MKVREISLYGFRGFNKEQSTSLHPRLTLVSAPNSHGKTSISEGFEFLLYGSTSKVATADSKDEYKGSYRNCHLPPSCNPTISVTVADDAGERTLQVDLRDYEFQRTEDGKLVDEWCFAKDALDAPRPFILQHALRDLLLAAPVDRFNRFATLLGLEALSTINKHLTAFCTKPPLPQEVRALTAWAEALVQRTAANAKVAPLSKALSKGLKKGLREFPDAISLAQKAARKYVPPDTLDADVADALALARKAVVSKVFDHPVKLEPYSPAHENSFTSSEASVLGLVTQSLIQSFIALSALR